MNKEQNIACSVGILTFNSAETLPRALKSVCNFSDVIISDGGSTDNTLSIAKEFGVRVIEQYAKDHPGPDSRHPITDFAREHNQLKEAAKEDWYLRIDSDEYISDELRAEIAEVVQTEKYDGCNLEMHLQSPDGSVTYRLPSPIFQPRLVRHKLGTYKRKIHETFVFFDKNPRLKTLKGAWNVPISKPDFATYKWAVNYRLRLLNETHPVKSFKKYLTRGWYKPFRNSFGILFRLLKLWLTTPRKQIPPLYYFRNRLYSQWVTFKTVNQLYFRKKSNE